MILFSSDDCVIVDKPSGILTVPSRMGRDDPRAVLGIQLTETLKRQVWPVHRLDFEVSGVVVFALHEQAHKILSACFEGREVQKSYEAWTVLPAVDVTAIPTEDDWQTWESKLLRGKKRAYESPVGKPATTKVRFQGEIEFNNLDRYLAWQLQPLTGRSHQLRFELAKRGFAIAGDVLYGAASTPFGQEVIALRAVSLDFKRCHGLKGLNIPPSIGCRSLAEHFAKISIK